MKRWLIGSGVALLLLLALVATQGPTLLLHFPFLIKILFEIRDPIGANQAIVWQPGPTTATASALERPPNIVLVMVDDLGWNDLSWNGGGLAKGAVPTPNIDSLARDGVQFSQGYAGNATCAPSRAALLTGRYPPRFGFESTPAPPAMGLLSAKMANERRAQGEPATIFYQERMPDVPPMREQGVPPEEITLAELLREAGYRTLMFGKWHLGDSPGQRPHEQGFDQFLGFTAGGSLYGAADDPEIVSSKQAFDPIDRIVWQVLSFAVRLNDGPRFTPDEYMTDYLSHQAVRAIEANRNRPFFLYLAYNAPHNPLQAKRSDYDALPHIEDHATRVYGAMLRSLDRGVGEVLEALERNGLEQNTLVVFVSDNGGAHYLGVPDLNAPYRGWKMTFFEGGLHSPFFLKWPARLPAGRSIDTPVTHFDIFSTAAAAAGIQTPRDRKIDGVNLLPFATTENPGEAHAALFWRSGDLHVAMADGWKLQVDGRQGKRWLFDLRADPTEQINLIDVSSDKARELEVLLAAHNRDLGPRTFPVLVEAVIPIDRHLASPHLEGEEYQYWPN